MLYVPAELDGRNRSIKADALLRARTAPTEAGGRGPTKHLPNQAREVKVTLGPVCLPGERCPDSAPPRPRTLASRQNHLPECHGPFQNLLCGHACLQPEMKHTRRKIPRRPHPAAPLTESQLTFTLQDGPLHRLQRRGLVVLSRGRRGGREGAQPSPESSGWSAGSGD